jgi:PIN domain nuclease of toxin-antitoxin system
VKSRNEVVLDASALLALLKSEPGSERVAAIMERAVIGAVNLAEVTSKLVRDGVPVDVIREWIEALEVQTRPFDQELAYATGALLPATRSRGLSLGDRACLALGRQLEATVLTTDRAWAGLDIGLDVDVIH